MSMDKIATEVVKAPGGFKRITMRQLREAHGNRSLGKRVVHDIHAEMATAGLGHCGHPGTDLPTRQEATVWVYASNAPIADLIKDVQAPGAAETTVRMIRDLVTSDAK